jgi:hypothetical protein
MATLAIFRPRRRPGDAIPTHKHLELDEIVLIEKGTIPMLEIRNAICMREGWCSFRSIHGSA